MNSETCNDNFISAINFFLRNESAQDISLDPDFNWESVFLEFRNHAISSLAIDSLEDAPVPSTLKALWKNDILMSCSHFFKLLHVQNDISKVLNTANINWCVLKGLSIAQYYSSPYQRAIGDIDILIAENDFEKAMELLRLAGFSFRKNIYKYDRHITAHKDGVKVEFHHYFARTRKRGKDKILNNLLYSALPNSVTATINNVTFQVLPPLENGIVIIEHIWHHLRTGIGLRHILDFIIYVDVFLDDEFWNNSFHEIASQLGYEVLCKAIARIGQLYFNIDDSIAWCKDVDISITNELMDLIISQGDFGSKESKNFNPVVRILNLKNESILSFLKYEYASGIITWKAAQKHAFLRPFAWIYAMGRHASKVVFNKENLIHLQSNKIQSSNQSKLLKKLRS